MQRHIGKRSIRRKRPTRSAGTVRTLKHLSHSSSELPRRDQPPSLTLAAANLHWSTTFYFADTKNLTVMDVSPTAIEVTRKRLGSAAERVHWLVGDVVDIESEPHAYDLWHDRAVFHFLTTPEHRLAYVRQVARAVKPGGHVIISTFGPEGLQGIAGSK